MSVNSRFGGLERPRVEALIGSQGREE